MAGRTVLELGAGSGLPSIVCALSGATKVVVTDYPDNDLIENLLYNIGLLRLTNETIAAAVKPNFHVIVLNFNSLLSLSLGQISLFCIYCHCIYAVCKLTQQQGYLWGNPTDSLLKLLPQADGANPGFDLLILADLLFNHSEHLKLIQSIRQTLKRSSSASALVFFTPYRPWLMEKDLAFFDHAKQSGFTVEKILERVMDKVMFENDPGVRDFILPCMAEGG